MRKFSPDSLDFPVNGVTPLLGLLQLHKDSDFRAFQGLDSRIDEIERLTETAISRGLGGSR